MINDLFIDIEKCYTNKIYLSNLSHNVKDILLCSFGGIPIQQKNNEFYLLNNLISKELLTTEVDRTLGLSGMVTYKNKSDFSLIEMGKKCKELKHLWGLNFINITLMFINQPSNVELSFLRDMNFYQSWSIKENNIYLFTGGIKDFMKFVEHKDDKTFDSDTRNAMNIIDNKFNFLWK